MLLKEQALAAQLAAAGGVAVPLPAAAPAENSSKSDKSDEKDGEGQRKLERYKREYLKYKQELKKVKKLQLDTAAQNNTLIVSILLQSSSRIST